MLNHCRKLVFLLFFVSMTLFFAFPTEARPLFKGSYVIEGSIKRHPIYFVVHFQQGSSNLEITGSIGTRSGELFDLEGVSFEANRKRHLSFQFIYPIPARHFPAFLFIKKPVRSRIKFSGTLSEDKRSIDGKIHQRFLTKHILLRGKRVKGVFNAVFLKGENAFVVSGERTPPSPAKLSKFAPPWPPAKPSEPPPLRRLSSQ